VVLPPDAVTLVTLGDVVDYIDQLVATQVGVPQAGTPQSSVSLVS
jgi:hypothetical protein